MFAIPIDFGTPAVDRYRQGLNDTAMLEKTAAAVEAQRLANEKSALANMFAQDTYQNQIAASDLGTGTARLAYEQAEAGHPGTLADLQAQNLQKQLYLDALYNNRQLAQEAANAGVGTQLAKVFYNQGMQNIMNQYDPRVLTQNYQNQLAQGDLTRDQINAAREVLPRQTALNLASTTSAMNDLNQRPIDNSRALLALNPNLTLEDLTYLANLPPDVANRVFRGITGQPMSPALAEILGQRTGTSSMYSSGGR